MKLLLCLAMLLILCASVGASPHPSSCTGWKVGSAYYDPQAWINPDSMYVSDDKRVSITGTTSTDSVAVKTFSLPIPTGVTIDSIDVAIEGLGTSSTTNRRVIKVALSTDGGLTVNGDYAIDTLNLTTDAVTTIVGTPNGLSNRKWGSTITAAQFAASTFAVKIIKNSTSTLSTLRIDLVRIRVWWTSSTVAYFGRNEVDEAVDTRLRQLAPTTNYATDTNGAFGCLRANGDFQSYLFLFPGLDSTLYLQTVDLAYLILNHETHNSSGDDVYGFYVLRRRDWVVGQATYEIYKTGSNWGDSGATSTTTDVYATSYSNFNRTDQTQNRDDTIDFTGALQAVDGTDTTSAGFLGYQVSGTGTSGGIPFRAADAPTVITRPYLQVWFHSAGTNHRRHMIMTKQSKKGP